MAVKHSLQLLSIAAIAFLFSGCCISPIDEDIDSTHMETLVFRCYSHFSVGSASAYPSQILVQRLTHYLD